ncbi:TPA: hypothetical protein CPT80_00445 [Candidatus Gastranaerophilales bacterium HUM_9]|nr:MAG TPA: hypothetical protein CPT80_00445 [Candidatus Gastranaerophilales bacterium HUM_9]HBX35514.1 hypothetical protein [Cyanobacteria bacterium UBA11440]
MTFELTVQNLNDKFNNKQQKSEIVEKIVADYTRYDEARATNLSQSNSLIDEIFFKKTTSNSSDKNEDWKSKVRMCKCFMFYQTLKAFIWRNIYSNINNMFDVSGENHESDNNSNKQKAVLVDILEKMNFQKTCDTVIDNALLYGELISYTAWKKKTEEYRRPIEFFRNLFSSNIQKLASIMQAIKQGKNFWVDSRVVFDNPYIYPVCPEDLVFDSSLIDDWDSCPKIYRTFKTPDSIINNKFYSIDKETAENISNLLKNNNSNNIQNSRKNLNAEVVNGSTVEVLEHWGDFKLSSGEVLHNWHAVVVARKYLILFKKNIGVINPFTYGAFIVDPITKRGISPIYSVLSLAKTQEEFLNKTINMQYLSENPPLLAPEGFFDDDEIALYPGKIIEYGDNLTSTEAFKQLSFDTKIFLNDIEFVDSLMCEVSGIFPSMIGTQENISKTATEINTKTQGQLTRLSMMLDIISQYFIVPAIKNVASLAANFKMGREIVFVNKDNMSEEIVIDDSVRQAEYKYTYADRNVLNDKYNNADLIVQSVEKFSSLIPLNVQEIFLWYFEQKGVENPERFLSQETQVQQDVQTQQGTQKLQRI